jgi:hypothetical protein
LKCFAITPEAYALVLGQVNPQSAHYEWAVGKVGGNNPFGKWNGTKWVEESGLGTGWTRVWTAPSDLCVEVLPSTLSGYGLGNSADEVSRFQTFTPPQFPGADAFNMIGVRLKVRRFSGSAQSDLQVALYATQNHKPVGFPKATAVVPASYIAASWTTIDAPLSYACDWLGHGIVAGTEYAIVLTQTKPQEARYEWAVGPTNFVRHFGKGNGSAWIDESGLGNGWMEVLLKQMAAPQ